jgi:hypothetical protein
MRGSHLATTPVSANEIVALGQQLYDRDIRNQVEPDHKGQMLALDVDSGTYAMGDDSFVAIQRLKAKVPDARAYLVRVGYSTAVRIGVGRKVDQR